ALEIRYYRRIILLALPISVQSLLYSSLGYIDSAMISQLGVIEVAGVGVGSKVLWIASSITFSFSIALSIFLSQAYGSSDKIKQKKCFIVGSQITFVSSIIVSLTVLFFASDLAFFLSQDEKIARVAEDYIIITSFFYVIGAIPLCCDTVFRSFQRPKYSTYITIFEVILTIVLNYLLIFGMFGFPELGVVGAALGTVLARTARAVVSLYILYKHYDFFRIGFKIKSDFINPIYEYVLFIKKLSPIVFNTIIWTLGLFVYQFAIGGLDTYSIAAFTILSATESLFTSLSWGVASAGGIIIGECIGNSKDNDYVKIVAKKLVNICLSFSIVLTACIIVFYPLIFSLFNLDSRLLENLLQESVPILSLSVFLKTFSMFYTSGLLTAGGDTKFNLYLCMGSQWLVSIPLCVLFSHYYHFEFLAIYSFMLFEEVLKIFGGWHRTRSNIWIKRLV
ncbi:MATE family efflux transporter, partial [Vibrio lentus]